MEREKKPRYNFDTVTLAISSGIILGAAGHKAIYLDAPLSEVGKLAILAGILATIGYGKAKAGQGEPSEPHSPSPDIK